MSNQQQNSYLGFNFWKKIESVTISLSLTGTWYWKVVDREGKASFSPKLFQYASDAEQDLITYLKNRI